MKRSAIICDNYKLDKFKEALDKSDFTYDVRPYFKNEECSMIQVRFNPEQIKQLTELVTNVEKFFIDKNVERIKKGIEDNTVIAAILPLSENTFMDSGYMNFFINIKKEQLEKRNGCKLKLSESYRYRTPEKDQFNTKGLKTYELAIVFEKTEL